MLARCGSRCGRWSRPTTAVAAWHYKDEYAFYDFEADADDLAELLDPAGWGDTYTPPMVMTGRSRGSSSSRQTDVVDVGSACIPNWSAMGWAHRSSTRVSSRLSALCRSCSRSRLPPSIIGPSSCTNGPGSLRLSGSSIAPTVVSTVRAHEPGHALWSPARTGGRGCGAMGRDGVAAVSFVVDDDELTAGPGLLQPPRGIEGAADVEPPVDEPAGDPGEPVGVAHDLVGSEPGVVTPAVGDLSGEAEPEHRVLVAGVRCGARGRGDVGVFPAAPRHRGRFPSGSVGIHQQTVVGVDQSKTTQLDRDVIAEGVPLRREEPAGVHGEPVDLGGRTSADRGEYHCDHPIGVTFGVGRAEYRSPREPEHDPTVDAQMPSQLLDVSDVMVHVDAVPVHVLPAGVRCASPGSPLIEQHGPMSLWIEVPACLRRATRARPAVQVHHRSSVSATHLLVVEDMAVADLKTSRCERLGRSLAHHREYVRTRLAMGWPNA